MRQVLGLSHKHRKRLPKPKHKHRVSSMDTLKHHFRPITEITFKCLCGYKEDYEFDLRHQVFTSKLSGWIDYHDVEKSLKNKFNGL